ncbi:hypothetical protein KDW_48180 [Dictyobacter vulcani]|uniref:Uncharacterized protein n=1 Tax=Dictyobacter vulcani TaxID=2607529 RepID=A0A5J4KZL2_9CHLR|nr:hypothetical protein KDW_48180 [Dictyobacter vulcani]
MARLILGTVVADEITIGTHCSIKKQQWLIITLGHGEENMLRSVEHAVNSTGPLFAAKVTTKTLLTSYDMPRF